MATKRKTLTLEDRRAIWIMKGEAVTRAREDRKKTAGRPADEVKRLRKLAAKTAAICADCFTPLAPDASVTLTDRFVEHIPGAFGYDRLGNWGPTPDRYLTVPICLHCWLISIANPGIIFRGQRQDGQIDHPGSVKSLYEIRRLRCEGCERPMRVQFYKRSRWPLPLYSRCCCTDCLHNAAKRRPNMRRRVRHPERTCAVCGKPFVPKQSTAKTCSNTCRQKMFRQRRASDV